jgi:plasmid maintenance system antidote protein VapI
MKKRNEDIENIWNEEKKSLVNEYIKSSRKTMSFDEILEVELLAIKYRIEDYLSSENTTERIEIIDFVKYYLKVLKVSQKNLAELFEMDAANLHKYLSGQRKLNADFVLKLSAFTSIEPEKWFQIEARNELQQIRKEYSKKKVNYVKQFQDYLKERKRLVVNENILQKKGRK